jgi:hypothetical protein
MARPRCERSGRGIIGCQRPLSGQHIGERHGAESGAGALQEVTSIDDRLKAAAV